jgi:hypothetical protein
VDGEPWWRRVARQLSALAGGQLSYDARMGKLRRFMVLALAACATYALLLVGLGVALRGCVAERVEQRMAAALDAEVEVGHASLNLLTGSIELGDIRVERQQGGHVAIQIERIEVDAAPLGWVVFDRVPEHVNVRGARMSVDAPGVLSLPEQPERPPLRIGGMYLEDIRLEMKIIDWLPGLGRIEIAIDRGRAGPVVLQGSLDWIFAVRELNASAELPGPRQVTIDYGEGTLRLGGGPPGSPGFLGARPVSVPFELPAPPPGAQEAEKLRILADAIIKAVGHEASRRWLEYKTREKLRELLD